MITFCNLKGISVSPFQQLFSVKTTFVFSQLLGSCYIPYLHGACIYVYKHIDNNVNISTFVRSSLTPCTSTSLVST